MHAEPNVATTSASRGLDEPRAAAAAAHGPRRMKRSSRWAVGLASLALALAYAFPLWHIALEAPQYPEGIGFYIWAGKLTGEKPQDLRSINGLNHYIGMKPIEPDTIAELRYMPLAIGALILGGLAVAITGRRRLLYVWLGAFVLFALVGLADFWWWEYDYGHNLDPTAAIKVPGMNYQPPLIGAKKLLNFTAHSWPALGGLAIMAGAVVAMAVTWIEVRRARTPVPTP